MGIGYPIKDFGQAWKLVRRVYLDALESLLVLVRELAEAR